MRLKDKVCVITGSSHGIGTAIAEGFAGEGAIVAVTYHTGRDEAYEVAKRIGTDLVFRLDVRERVEIRHVFDAVAGKHRKIDVLVNNAGILERTPFQQITDAEWDRIMAVNLRGTFLCCQEVMPVMAAQRAGCIINISSSGGQLGGTLAVHYAVSKAGIIALTKSLARIGAKDGVRVNCVAPGLIQTEMTEAEIESAAGQEKIARDILLHRAGQPHEVAAVVAFLASDQASYVTGQTFNVNGGLFMG